jgi:hypothetical protein
MDAIYYVARFITNHEGVSTQIGKSKPTINYNDARDLIPPECERVQSIEKMYNIEYWMICQREKADKENDKGDVEYYMKKNNP